MNAVRHPKLKYLCTWSALLGLLLLTWFAAQFDLGAFNAIVATAISAMKMFLVLLFFVHLGRESKVTWVFAAAGLVWFLIMVDLTLSDYLSRRHELHTLPQNGANVNPVTLSIDRNAERPSPVEHP